MSEWKPIGTPRVRRRVMGFLIDKLQCWWKGHNNCEYYNLVFCMRCGRKRWIEEDSHE